MSELLENLGFNQLTVGSVSFNSIQSVVAVGEGVWDSNLFLYPRSAKHAQRRLLFEQELVSSLLLLISLLDVSGVDKNVNIWIPHHIV